MISSDLQIAPTLDVTNLVFLLRDIVQRQRQQEVLGTDKEATPLLVQQQSAEAAGTLQLEASHSVELLQLCEWGKQGFRGWRATI